ncbi:MAG: hypothetical protein ACXWNK_04840 [Vulcanimicrobiaceae bacterium]
MTTAIAFAVDQKPVRHLVYKFDVGIESTLTARSSGIGDGTGGSGVANYTGGNSDQGTITLDVLQVANDGTNALTVQISEQARNTRTAKPTLCVVYPDTHMICDPNGKINEEEAALLQVAGRNFVDPLQFDAHKHWKVGGSGNGFSSSTDFTLTGGDPSSVVTITLQRLDKLEGAQGYNSVTDGTLSYNMPLSVPTAVKEDTVMRESKGMGQDNRVDTHVSLSLVSDSQQPAKP